jgi:hypothetical protein
MKKLKVSFYIGVKERVMSVEKKKTKGFHLGRRRIAFVALILLIFASLEVYAQTYVQIHSLSVVTEENAQSFAQQSIGGSDSFFKIDTYNFSSSGCRWLLILETLKNTTNPENWAFVDIFKTEQNGSYFVSSIDLLILDVKGQYKNSNEQGESFDITLDHIFDNSNYTTVRIIYTWFSTGISDAVFNLTVRVYQRTLIGLIPKEQVTIPLNTTITA